MKQLKKLTNTEETIAKFEQLIYELIKQGVKPEIAVRMAYSKYPVMKVMQREAEDELITAIKEGYGKGLSDEMARQALKLSWTPDKLTLSKRTTQGRKKVQQTVARIIAGQIRRNKNYKQTAIRIYDGYNQGGHIPQQDVPKFIKQLISKSKCDRVGNKEFEKDLRKVFSKVGKLKTPGLRAGYKQLLKAIETRSDYLIRKALRTAIHENTRYFAERIARTEHARAYHDGFIARYADDEDVVAYKWCLSSGHPTYDVCDLYANANLYGLGKGIFPKDKVPILPAHPNCMCSLRPVYKGTIDEAKLCDRHNEGGQEYIDKLPKHRQKALLGVKGEASYQKDKNSWPKLAHGCSKNMMTSRIDSIFDTQLFGVKNPTKPGGILNKADFIHDKKKHVEIKMAERLTKQFGGNIILVDETKFIGKSPDYLWDGVPWELKTLSLGKPKALDGRLRTAIHQVKEVSRDEGGVVLDITNCKFSIDDCIDVVKNRMLRSLGASGAVIIIDGEKYCCFSKFKK